MSLSRLDQCISKFDESLRAISGKLPPTSRDNPAAHLKTPALTATETKHAAGLMRVNHTGEVCAQALYLGQSTVASSEKIKQELQQCAAEEVDHLFWCQQRLQQLESHVSFLNPLWFGGSFILGVVAGLAGDQWNLGFLAETEKQVEAHLEKHLEKLPSADKASLAIVNQMRADEAKHADTAMKHGAAELPFPLKTLMQVMSKLMTTTAYYF